MPLLPFFQYPYNINRYYPRNNMYYRNNYQNNLNNDDTIKKDDTSALNEKSEEKEQKNMSSRYSGFLPIHFQNPLSIDSDEPVLEVLGISLYLDDLIILGLLFFLYKEEVKDEMLFLILILLLLT